MTQKTNGITIETGTDNWLILKVTDCSNVKILREKPQPETIVHQPSRWRTQIDKHEKSKKLSAESGSFLAHSARAKHFLFIYWLRKQNFWIACSTIFEISLARTVQIQADRSMKTWDMAKWRSERFPATQSPGLCSPCTRTTFVDFEQLQIW